MFWGFSFNLGFGVGELEFLVRSLVGIGEWIFCCWRNLGFRKG